MSRRRNKKPGVGYGLVVAPRSHSGRDDQPTKHQLQDQLKHSTERRRRQAAAKRRQRSQQRGARNSNEPSPKVEPLVEKPGASAPEPLTFHPLPSPSATHVPRNASPDRSRNVPPSRPSRKDHRQESDRRKRQPRLKVGASPPPRPRTRGSTRRNKETPKKRKSPQVAPGAVADRGPGSASRGQLGMQADVVVKQGAEQLQALLRRRRNKQPDGGSSSIVAVDLNDSLHLSPLGAPRDTQTPEDSAELRNDSPMHDASHSHSPRPAPKLTPAVILGDVPAPMDRAEQVRRRKRELDEQRQRDLARKHTWNQLKQRRGAVKRHAQQRLDEFERGIIKAPLPEPGSDSPKLRRLPSSPVVPTSPRLLTAERAQEKEFRKTSQPVDKGKPPQPSHRPHPHRAKTHQLAKPSKVIDPPATAGVVLPNGSDVLSGAAPSSAVLRDAQARARALATLPGDRASPPRHPPSPQSAPQQTVPPPPRDAVQEQDHLSLHHGPLQSRNAHRTEVRPGAGLPPRVPTVHLQGPQDNRRTETQTQTDPVDDTEFTDLSGLGDPAPFPELDEITDQVNNSVARLSAHTAALTRAQQRGLDVESIYRRNQELAATTQKAVELQHYLSNLERAAELQGQQLHETLSAALEDSELRGLQPPRLHMSQSEPRPAKIAKHPTLQRPPALPAVSAITGFDYDGWADKARALIGQRVQLESDLVWGFPPEKPKENVQQQPAPPPAPEQGAPAQAVSQAKSDQHEQPPASPSPTPRASRRKKGKRAAGPRGRRRGKPSKGAVKGRRVPVRTPGKEKTPTTVRHAQGPREESTRPDRPVHVEREVKSPPSPPTHDSPPHPLPARPNTRTANADVMAALPLSASLPPSSARTRSLVQDRLALAGNAPAFIKAKEQVRRRVLGDAANRAKKAAPDAKKTKTRRTSASSSSSAKAPVEKASRPQRKLRRQQPRDTRSASASARPSPVDTDYSNPYSAVLAGLGFSMRRPPHVSQPALTNAPVPQRAMRSAPAPVQPALARRDTLPPTKSSAHAQAHKNIASGTAHLQMEAKLARVASSPMRTTLRPHDLHFVSRPQPRPKRKTSQQKSVASQAAIRPVVKTSARVQTSPSITGQPVTAHVKTYITPPSSPLRPVTSSVGVGTSTSPAETHPKRSVAVMAVPSRSAATQAQTSGSLTRPAVPAAPVERPVQTDIVGPLHPPVEQQPARSLSLLDPLADLLPRASVLPRPHVLFDSQTPPTVAPSTSHPAAVDPTAGPHPQPTLQPRAPAHPTNAEAKHAAHTPTTQADGKASTGIKEQVPLQANANNQPNAAEKPSDAQPPIPVPTSSDQVEDTLTALIRNQPVAAAKSDSNVPVTAPDVEPVSAPPPQQQLQDSAALLKLILQLTQQRDKALMEAQHPSTKDTESVQLRVPDIKLSELPEHSAARERFERTLVNNLSKLTGAPPDAFHILRLSAGSVVVDLEIAGSGNLKAADIKRQVEEAAEKSPQQLLDAKEFFSPEHRAEDEAADRKAQHAAQGALDKEAQLERKLAELEEQRDKLELKLRESEQQRAREEHEHKEHLRAVLAQPPQTKPSTRGPLSPSPKQKNRDTSLLDALSAGTNAATTSAQSLQHSPRGGSRAPGSKMQLSPRATNDLQQSAVKDDTKTAGSVLAALGAPLPKKDQKKAGSVLSAFGASKSPTRSPRSKDDGKKAGSVLAALGAPLPKKDQKKAGSVLSAFGAPKSPTRSPTRSPRSKDDSKKAGSVLAALGAPLPKKDQKKAGSVLSAFGAPKSPTRSPTRSLRSKDDTKKAGSVLAALGAPLSKKDQKKAGSVLSALGAPKSPSRSPKRSPRTKGNTKAAGSVLAAFGAPLPTEDEKKANSVLAALGAPSASASKPLSPTDRKKAGAMVALMGGKSAHSSDADALAALGARKSKSPRQRSDADRLASLGGGDHTRKKSDAEILASLSAPSSPRSPRRRSDAEILHSLKAPTSPHRPRGPHTASGRQRHTHFHRSSLNHHSGRGAQWNSPGRRSPLGNMASVVNVANLHAKANSGPSWPHSNSPFGLAHDRGMFSGRVGYGDRTRFATHSSAHSGSDRWGAAPHLAELHRDRFSHFVPRRGRHPERGSAFPPEPRARHAQRFAPYSHTDDPRRFHRQRHRRGRRWRKRFAPRSHAVAPTPLYGAHAGMQAMMPTFDSKTPFPTSSGGGSSAILQQLLKEVHDLRQVVQAKVPKPAATRAELRTKRRVAFWKSRLRGLGVSSSFTDASLSASSTEPSPVRASKGPFMLGRRPPRAATPVQDVPISDGEVDVSQSWEPGIVRRPGDVPFLGDLSAYSTSTDSDSDSDNGIGDDVPSNGGRIAHASRAPQGRHALVHPNSDDEKLSE